MKSTLKCLSLFLIALSTVGCDSAKSDETSKGAISSGVRDPLTSAVMDDGVTLEAFQTATNELATYTYTHAVITYDIKEVVEGTVPYWDRNGKNKLTEGEYNNHIEIEMTKSSTRLLSERATTNAAAVFENGTPLNINGWLSYHSEKRRFRESAQEGEGFDERFYLTPSYRMWMKSYGNRVANATFEGTYKGSEEYNRVFNEYGLVTNMSCTDSAMFDGILKRWNTADTEYHGTYVLTCVATVEYFTE